MPEASSPRRLLVPTLLLVAGFSYGFVAAKRGLFPSAWISALVADADATSKPKNAGPVETVLPTGWWVETGERHSEDAITENLGDLGYGQSYGVGADEWGVVDYDEARASDGWNLIVSAHEPAALLADMQGEVVHEWTFPFDDIPKPAGFEQRAAFGTRYFRRAALLDGGALLALYDGAALIKLDKDSRLEWSLLGGYHHDLDVAADGSIWVLTHEAHVVPRLHETAKVKEDFVTRVSADGEVLGKWSLLEAFENSAYAPLLTSVNPEQRSGDIFHTNTITMFDGSLAHHSPLFAEGNALVSVWGLDTVAIVDLGANEVVWALTGLWHRQHEPIVLENGNLLVFDNMGANERSSVIEIEPFTQRIAWSFVGDDENDFYSALCGTSARLANGNTLITESLSGRAFEVAPDGEVVWRYLSPFRVEQNGKDGVAVLMEVVRLPQSLPLDWLDADSR